MPLQVFLISPTLFEPDPLRPVIVVLLRYIPTHIHPITDDFLGRSLGNEVSVTGPSNNVRTYHLWALFALLHSTPGTRFIAKEWVIT